jgi:hypothetical protein
MNLPKKFKENAFLLTLYNNTDYKYIYERGITLL